MTKDNDAPWRPSLGACVRPDGVSFRVWAPGAEALEVELAHGVAPPAFWALDRRPDGYFEGLIASAAAGDAYRYRLNGKDSFPDPASRFQPDGVHGRSLIVDARLAGVGAGAVAVLLRAPFWAVIVVGAAATAAARMLS